MSGHHLLESMEKRLAQAEKSLANATDALFRLTDDVANIKDRNRQLTNANKTLRRMLKEQGEATDTKISEVRDEVMKGHIAFNRRIIGLKAKSNRDYRLASDRFHPVLIEVARIVKLAPQDIIKEGRTEDMVAIRAAVAVELKRRRLSEYAIGDILLRDHTTISSLLKRHKSRPSDITIEILEKLKNHDDLRTAALEHTPAIADAPSDRGEPTKETVK